MDRCWQLVIGVGAAFWAVGWLDVALLWYPPQIGTAGWEFGVISASLNGLPVPVIGTVFILAGAVALGHRRLARGAQIAGLVAVVIVGFMAVLYGLSAPVTLGTASDPTGMGSIKKTLARSLVQIGLYPVVIGWVVFRANRFIKSGDNGSYET